MYKSRKFSVRVVFRERVRGPNTQFALYKIHLYGKTIKDGNPK